MAAGQDSHFLSREIRANIKKKELVGSLLKEKFWESVPAINKKKKTSVSALGLKAFRREKSGHIILFSFLFISRDMIHVTIFFSFYCWPTSVDGP